MQKKIIALAVAGLVSGAAFAQSNVTVYGAADVSVQKTTNGKLQAAAGGTFDPATGAAFNIGTSRIGFMGSEDLGGGLKANFNFDQAVNIANGATDANAYQRTAWVGLSGGFGALQVGRNYTVGFDSNKSYELTGEANYTVMGIFGFNGGSRNDAQVKYMSPSFGGVTVAVGHVLKPNNGGVAGETGFAATYANGPIAVSASYADLAVGKDTSIGGSFDFGMGKVAASFQDPEGVSKGWTLGVGSIKAGPALLTLDYARNTGNSAAATAKSAMLFEARYPLSKRSMVYGGVRKTNYNGAESMTTTGLGLRHTF